MSVSTWTSRIENSPKEQYDRLLYDATASGEPEDMEKLLALGANIVKIEEDNGRSALHIAAEKGLEKKVKVLTKVAGSVDLTDGDDRTPLYYAAGKGHVQCVKILLEHPSKIIRNLGEAIKNAVHKKQHQTTELLLDYLIKEDGVDECIEFFSACLDEIVKTGDKLMIDIFLKKGALINSGVYCEFSKTGYARAFLEVVNCSYSDNGAEGYISNPLITAIRQNNLPLVKWLVSKGAEVNIIVICDENYRDDNHSRFSSHDDLYALSPVELAKKLEHNEIVEYLETLQKSKT